MITLNIEDKSFDLKTNYKEITIGEFSQWISKDNNIDEENKQYYKTWLDLFEVLKMPEYFLDNIAVDDLIEIIKSMEIHQDYNKEILKTIEIDGYTYELYSGDKFKMTVRIANKIEEITKRYHKQFIIRSIATLYKRTDLTEKEHNDNTHIEHKMKLFSELPTDMFISLLSFLFESIMNNIEKLNS